MFEPRRFAPRGDLGMRDYIEWSTMATATNCNAERKRPFPTHIGNGLFRLCFDSCCLLVLAFVARS
jgi:hypothetical protein